MTFADVIQTMGGFTHLNRTLRLRGLMQLMLCAFISMVLENIFHLWTEKSRSSIAAETT